MPRQLNFWEKAETFTSNISIVRTLILENKQIEICYMQAYQWIAGLHWDFNSHHTEWGCSNYSADGDFLVDWASTAEVTLLYDPKEPRTFYSARSNSSTNPDLAFEKWHNNQPLPVRHILDMFPRSHHRPSLITIPSLFQPVQGRDANRWNYRKANFAGTSRH